MERESAMPDGQLRGGGSRVVVAAPARKCGGGQFREGQQAVGERKREQCRQGVGRKSWAIPRAFTLAFADGGLDRADTNAACRIAELQMGVGRATLKARGRKASQSVHQRISAAGSLFGVRSSVWRVLRAVHCRVLWGRKSLMEFLEARLL